MLRRSSASLTVWRVRYHRARLPRAHALRLHKEKLAADAAKRDAAAAASAAGSSNGAPAPSESLLPGFARSEMAPQTYKYNRFFVNHELQFIAQEHIVEDPAVIHRRRTQLEVAGSGEDKKPGADAAAASQVGTPEKLWRTPHQPWMDPLLPFIRVLDYPKDPDAKYLKPTNIPRWKDFMMRKSPSVPRTWY